MHPATLSSAELLKHCQQKRVRRSGPGGQHRNKVETGIVLTYEPEQITVEASEKRSQSENFTVAVKRLRIALALEVREELVENTQPSELWKSRCRQQKILINPNHDDYPALLAEALDHLFFNDTDVKATAEILCCSSSQLLKFLKKEPRAFQRLNTWRAEKERSIYH